MKVQSASEHQTLQLGNEPLSIEPYRSPAYFELERDRLFRRAWLNVAHVSDVPGPGDFIVRKIEVCKASVLIVRGNDNIVRAFHDVCSHRGSKVSPPGVSQGCVKALRCRYHAWTYDLDGRLLFVPDARSFPGLDTSAAGLTPIHCELWEGFIFLNFEPRPSVSLETWLGQFGERLRGMQALAGFPLHPETVSVSMASEWACNWKLATGAFNEAYHIRVLHPRTIGNTFASTANPFGHPAHIDTCGPHRLIGLYGNSDYRVEASRDRLEAALFPGGLYRPRTRQERGTKPMPHPAMNVTDAVDWSQDINCFFPNFYMQVQVGSMFTVRWWPMAHDRVRWEATLFSRKPRNVRERLALEYNLIRQRNLVLEDAVNLEEQHEAIGSGAQGKTHFHYSEHERLLRHQHETVDRFIAADNIAELLA